MSLDSGRRSLGRVGRQIGFCNFAARDLERVGQFAEKASPGALWLPWRFAEERPPTVPASAVDATQPGYFVRVADLPNVVTHFVPTQGYWVVEQFPSPAIECGLGRLFIDTGYWVGENWVPRGSDFVAWYDAIAKWVRRNYRRNAARHCWEGSGSQAPPSA